MELKMMKLKKSAQILKEIQMKKQQKKEVVDRLQLDLVGEMEKVKEKSIAKPFVMTPEMKESMQTKAKF